MFYVYALIDPIKRHPFYIGKGCGERMNAHLKGYDKVNKSKIERIANIRMLGFEPYSQKILDGLEEAAAFEFEQYCIKSCLIKGFDLVNRVGVQNPPIRKGAKLTIEQKLKMKGRTPHNKGKPMSQAQKAHLSNKLKGIPKSNRVTVDVQLLHQLYIVENKTKAECRSILGIGPHSLNRILSENQIRKLRR